MSQKISSRIGTVKIIPRTRAHFAKAMALAVLATSLPAQGHKQDVSQSKPGMGPESLQYNGNAPPVAVTDHINLKHAAYGINVLANDADENQDALTVIEATAQFGAVAFTTDGLVAYAADPAQARADTITYVVSDGRGGQAQGSVIVSVQ